MAIYVCLCIYIQRNNDVWNKLCKLNAKPLLLDIISSLLSRLYRRALPRNAIIFYYDMLCASTRRFHGQRSQDATVKRYHG